MESNEKRKISSSDYAILFIVESLWWSANPKEMGVMPYVDFWFYSWKGIRLTVYESLMFAIAFATLIFHISNKNNKK